MLRCMHEGRLCACVLWHRPLHQALCEDLEADDEDDNPSPVLDHAMHAALGPTDEKSLAAVMDIVLLRQTGTIQVRDGVA